MLGVAVLSRWPIIGVREHRLPARHRPDDPVALHATIEHPAGQLHVIVSCVEWEPTNADDHLAQIRALAQLISDPALDGPLPVLLAADLNAPPDAIEVAALTDLMTDAWVAAGGAPDAVTVSANNPYVPREAKRQIDQRIDYILVGRSSAGRRVTATQVFTVHGPIDGVHPSDHAPVVVDMQL